MFFLQRHIPYRLKPEVNVMTYGYASSSWCSGFSQQLKMSLQFAKNKNVIHEYAVEQH